MPITLVAQITAAGGGTGATSSAIDTTGASLIVIPQTKLISGAPLAPIGDNKGNLYTPLTQRNASSVGGTIFYCVNPVVGSGHTFTTGNGSASAFSSAIISAWGSGGVFDQQNGAVNTGAVSARTTGSVTPSENNELIIAMKTAAGAETAGAGVTIDAGFTLLTGVAFSSGQHFGVSAAYLIQTTAGAVNPNFAWAAGDAHEVAAAIATFKIAVAGAGIGGPLIDGKLVGGGPLVGGRLIARRAARPIICVATLRECSIIAASRYRENRRAA